MPDCWSSKQRLAYSTYYWSDTPITSSCQLIKGSSLQALLHATLSANKSLHAICGCRVPGRTGTQSKWFRHNQRSRMVVGSVYDQMNRLSVVYLVERQRVNYKGGEQYVSYKVKEQGVNYKVKEQGVNYKVGEKSVSYKVGEQVSVTEQERRVSVTK